MSLNRSTFFKFAAAATVAAGALFAGTAANAGGAFSVGINLPGLAIGVAPGYYEPAPVYYRPSPVYYDAPPVYYRPAPGYYRGHGHGHGHGYYRDGY